MLTLTLPLTVMVMVIVIVMGIGMGERRYPLSRRTQALKETNRFKPLVPRIHTDTQGGHELMSRDHHGRVRVDVPGSPWESLDRFIVLVNHCFWTMDLSRDHHGSLFR